MCEGASVCRSPKKITLIMPSVPTIALSEHTKTPIPSIQTSIQSEKNPPKSLHPQRPSGDIGPDFFVRSAARGPGAPVPREVAQVSLAHVGASVWWWEGAGADEVGESLGGCDARGAEGKGDVVPALMGVSKVCRV